MRKIIFYRIPIGAALLLTLLNPAASSLAASSIWSGATSGDWADPTDWFSGVPGAADTAIFGLDDTGHKIILPGTATIQTVSITSSLAPAYTFGAAIGSGSVTFGANNGGITVASSVTTPQTFNSNIILGIAGAGTDYLFTNNGTAKLTITGNVTSSGGGNKNFKLLGTGDGVFSGSVSAGVALVKQSGSTGTWVISGTSSTNVASNVSGGTMVMNGSFTTTQTFFADNNGVLAGTGSVTAPNLNINNNGTFAPGDSTLAEAAQTGTFSQTGNMTFNNTSTLKFQLGGATPADGQGYYDQANVSGSITLNTTTINLNVSLVNNFAPLTSNVFYIVTRGDFAGWSRTFLGLAEGATVDLGNGATGQITYFANWTGTQGDSTVDGGNDVAIYNVVAVPEPHTVVLLGGALGFLLIVGRKRRNFSKI
jgi:hypothetical protein